ncbi:hypothetical protein P389DRAFT_174489 [Cystobasidium minutum MCA 4210]|uniref:uncharacterized protein n=1 Tax=Cystobasidium minutum MCA 4210 TaxID=1397322 RepID=UPI0034CDE583|eukprot:jgi/Rhomi1/174489/fgenesh1_kg.8_\
MCMQSICANEGCGKKTWWGCGKHIDSVMSKIPKEEQCHCDNHNAMNPASAMVQSVLGSGSKSSSNSASS